MRLATISDGRICIYEISHAATSGRNESAVTAPSVAALILAANSQDGRLTPRLMRLIAVRSTATRSANCSSVSLRPSIHCDNVMRLMARNVRYSHSACQAQCAQGAVDDIPAWGQCRPMPEKTNFFKEHRKHNGLTQEAAAAQIGIDRSYLSKLETRKETYNEAFLVAAAKVYKCRPDELLNRDPRIPPSLVDEFSALPLDLQEQLLEIARTFKRKTG